MLLNINPVVEALFHRSALSLYNFRTPGYLKKVVGIFWRGWGLSFFSIRFKTGIAITVLRHPLVEVVFARDSTFLDLPKKSFIFLFFSRSISVNWRLNNNSTCQLMASQLCSSLPANSIIKWFEPDLGTSACCYKLNQLPCEFKDSHSQEFDFKQVCYQPA